MKYIKPINEWISNLPLIKFHINKMINKIQSKSKVKIKINQVEKDESSDILIYHFRYIINHKIFEKILKNYQKVLINKNILLSYHVSEDSNLTFNKKTFDLEIDKSNKIITKTFILYVKTLHTERVKPGKYLFHASYRDNREDIKKNGLKLSGWENGNWTEISQLYYPPTIFATNEYDTWDKYDDIWIIKTKDLKNKWWKDLNFYKKNTFLTGAYMTFENIPPEHLELLDRSKLNTINSQLLQERKNYPTLYHFTQFLFLILILDSNKLMSSNLGWESERRRMMKNLNKKYTDYISFTRNKKFNSVNHLSSGGRTIIEIDGEKLTDNYKLVPFTHFYGKKKEFEESLLLKNKKFINIKEYIIKLYIPSFEIFSDEVKDYFFEGFELDGIISDINKILNKKYFIDDLIDNELEMRFLYEELITYIKKTKIPFEIIS